MNDADILKIREAQAELREFGLREALRVEQARANTWFEIAGNMQTERDALRTENSGLRAALDGLEFQLAVAVDQLNEYKCLDEPDGQASWPDADDMQYVRDAWDATDHAPLIPEPDSLGG